MMSLRDAIVEVERVNFRTGHDTGAQTNALIVWNHLRQLAGMEPLTMDDLIQRHAETNGVSFEVMKEDYRKMDRVQELVRHGKTYQEAFDTVDREAGK